MQSVLEVVNAEASQDLVSLYTFRSELAITDDSNDKKYERWISDASARISDFCGRSFRRETVTETFWSPAHGREPCMLSRAPVISVASVVENGITLASDTYRLRGQRLWKLSSAVPISWSHVGEIVVTYDAGYSDVADVPGVLQRACLSLVSNYYFLAQRSPTVRRESVSVDGIETVSQEYVVADTGAAQQSLPTDIQSMLSNYRDIWI